MPLSELDNLVRIHQLKYEPGTQSEFNNLLHSGTVRLNDARYEENSMNRSDLVIRLSTLSGVSLHKAEEAVDSILYEMTETLASGQRIEIRGFGSFDLAYRPAWIARNPRSGETFPMDGKYFPAFKAGRHLREHLKN